MAKDKTLENPFNLDDKKAQEKADKKAEAKRRKELRNEITHKLRFDVLERDKYTCQYCGASPHGKRNNGEEVELVVDHIVPLDKGGDNKLTNLITACWICNEGKKNRELARTTLRREYNLPEDLLEIVQEVTEDNDFEQWKQFWVKPEHEEVREMMYDMNELIPGQTCIADCSKCVFSGTWYFKGCLQILKRYLTKGSFTSDVDQNFVEESSTALMRLRGSNITEKIPVGNSQTNTLRCDYCYLSRRCPKYYAGAFCAYDFTDDQNFADVESSLSQLVKVQKERVVRGAFFEKIDGGALDKNVSQEMILLSRLLKQMEDSNKPTASFSITAEGTQKEGTDVVADMMANIFNKKSKDEKKIDSAENAQIIDDND